MKDSKAAWAIGIAGVGAIVALLGTLMDWGHALGFVQVRGLQTTGGRTLAVIALIAVVTLAVPAGASRYYRIGGVLSAILGILVLLIAFLNIQDIVETEGAELGIGLLVCLLGSLLMLGGAVFLFARGWSVSRRE